MKSRKIVTRHVLADRIPLLAAAVLMIIGQYLPKVAVAAAVEPLSEFISDSDLLLSLYFIVVILFSLLLVLLFERWFYPEYEGSLKGKGFGRGMLAALPVIVFIIAYRVFKAALGYEALRAPSLFTILQGLRAGVNEEAVFRGIAAALLLRQFRSAKNIWVPAVFTGVFFGCTHLLNLFSGDTVLNVLVNVVFASSVGLIPGVIFTFSGNLWPVVLVHSLYDTLAFLARDLGMPDWPVFTEVGIFAVIAVVYLLVLQRKRAELAAFWDGKRKNRVAAPEARET